MGTLKLDHTAPLRVPGRALLWLAMLCSLALIIYFGLLSRPPVTWLMVAHPRADLVLHLLAFACLAIIAFALFGIYGRVVLALLAAGAAIEILQMLAPPREPSLLDMLANAAGIALAAAVLLAGQTMIRQLRAHWAWPGFAGFHESAGRMTEHP